MECIYAPDDGERYKPDGGCFRYNTTRKMQPFTGMQIWPGEYPRASQKNVQRQQQDKRKFQELCDAKSESRDRGIAPGRFFKKSEKSCDPDEKSKCGANVGGDKTAMGEDGWREGKKGKGKKGGCGTKSFFSPCIDNPAKPKSEQDERQPRPKNDFVRIVV